MAGWMRLLAVVAAIESAVGCAGVGGDGGAGGDGVGLLASPDPQAARDGGSDRDGGSRPACGNGVVDPGEVCDTAIPAGRPGACPAHCDRTEACVDRVLRGFGTCLARCEDVPITAPSPVQDFCCPDGATSIADPDCPVPYPFTVSRNARRDGKVWGGSSGCERSQTTTWHARIDDIPAALRPTACRPVVLTVHSEDPGKGEGAYSHLDVGLWTEGAEYREEGVDVYANAESPRAYVLLPVQGRPAFAVAHYTATEGCGNVNYPLDPTVFLRFEELAPVPVREAAARARAARLAGDAWGQYLLVEERVDGHRAVRVAFASSAPDLLADSWIATGSPFGGFVTVSTAGHAASDPSMTIESLDQAPPAPVRLPVAHVVWVEDAESLRYAAVGPSGAAQSIELRRGASLHHPQVALWDEDRLGIAWTEKVGGRDRLRFALYDLHRGALGPVTEVTAGEGDATSPALDARHFESVVPDWRAALAWIDTRSGAPQLFFARLDGRTGAVRGQPSAVDAAAIDPEEPDLKVAPDGAVLVLWTDHRDGKRALYVADMIDDRARGVSRVSPAGEDAHGGRLAHMPNREGMLYGNPDFGEPVLWTSEDQGDTVRYGRLHEAGPGRWELLDLSPLRLACDGTETSAPALSWVWTDRSSSDGYTQQPRLYASWIEDGAVVWQMLPSRTFSRRRR